MRIAIVGGGTAGFMAAAELSHRFPAIELLHVFDPAIPSVGVGEGTTPAFRSWLDDLGPISIETLTQECDATVKRGIRFENWGRTNPLFRHDFIPRDKSGLHISASRILPLLDRFVRADRIRGSVAQLQRDDRGVTIIFDDSRRELVDIVVDARGFPKDTSRSARQLSWIPTNAALLARCGPRPSDDRTRAVARPHGWMFVIPLTTATSYGYVYGGDCASPEEVRADFDSFLAAEGIDPAGEPRHLTFPNFVWNEPFDGLVFKVGNTASFIEPLEATSIALVRSQLRILGAWLRMRDRKSIAADLAPRISNELRHLVLQVSLFIGWHYAMGSVFDTPFWRKAQSGFQQGYRTVPEGVRALFDKHLRVASKIPVDQLDLIETEKDLEEFVTRYPELPEPFGGMTVLGFAQVAAGIGYAFDNNGTPPLVPLRP